MLPNGWIHSKITAKYDDYNTINIKEDKTLTKLLYHNLDNNYKNDRTFHS